MRIKVVVLLTALLFGTYCFAQAPPSLPGYQISLSAGYSATTGNNTNNGMWASVAVPLFTFNNAFAKKWDMTLSGRGDYFTLRSPANYVITAGPEFRFQFSKPNLLNGIVFQPFANLGLGVTRAQCVSAGTCVAGSDILSHFSYKIGGGIDIPVSSVLSLRLVEVDFLHSNAFPTGSIFISNLAQLSTGLKLTF